MRIVSIPPFLQSRRIFKDCANFEVGLLRSQLLLTSDLDILQCAKELRGQGLQVGLLLSAPTFSHRCHYNKTERLFLQIFQLA